MNKRPFDIIWKTYLNGRPRVAHVWAESLADVVDIEVPKVIRQATTFGYVREVREVVPTGQTGETWEPGQRVDQGSEEHMNSFFATYRVYDALGVPWIWSKGRLFTEGLGVDPDVDGYTAYSDWAVKQVLFEGGYIPEGFEFELRRVRQ